MDTPGHWERVYGTREPTERSWFRPHLDTSPDLIERVASNRSKSIVDVGGGESTLVDDLIGRGYRIYGSQGPSKCGGLDVMRYDVDSLHAEFGARFRVMESSKELHQTPFGTTQRFLYCYFIVE